MYKRSRRDEPTSLSQVPLRANMVLNIVFCTLLLIGLRVWHLAVIQHDKKVEEAFIARKKCQIVPPARGTIRDRFNVLLAANSIDYRASIVYSQFRQVPSFIVERDEKGNKRRRYLRREYIKQFSYAVANVLSMDPERLEDIIYSHAAQNNSIPYVIKSGLSEEEYYRLKLLEKDFNGIQVQCVPRRYYPRGRTAADVIGYLGPISKEKYARIVNESTTLSDYVKRKEQGQEVEPPDLFASFAEAKKRHSLLVSQAYTINDSVGLLGIEASFEEALRGYCGRRLFFSDAQGNALRELPGSVPPIPGKRVLLSLSVELQEFAEELLAQAEAERGQKAKEPVMRGGALVAMDPKTGEVVALASFPSFDPNDFIRSKGSSSKVLRWLENESYFGKVWDQFLPLTYERYNEKMKKVVPVEEYLTWDRYLELLLPHGSDVGAKLPATLAIKEVIALQKSAKEPIIIDLTRLVLNHNDFSEPLIARLGDLTIDEFRSLSSSYTALCNELKPDVRAHWKKTIYLPWRKQNEKEFLKGKRLDEKRAKIAPKPYLDYIDKEEAQRFEQFWCDFRHELVLAKLGEDWQDPHYVALQGAVSELEASLKKPFLLSLKGFSALNEPLRGAYPHLVSGDKVATLQDLVMGLRVGFGQLSMRSFAFRQPAIQGSLFKLVTAYTGLMQRYKELKGAFCSKDVKLFEIVDRTFKQNGKNYVGLFSSGAPIPQIYKGGRIPKSLHPDLGKMDLLQAIELSSNPYFSLLAGDYLKDPMQLYQAASDFGFGQKTKIALPGEASGFLPADIAYNRTGLYSMAIGQHTLLTTPLQTAVMLSALSNGGTELTPRIVNMLVGKEQAFEERDSSNGDHFAYKEPLKLVGIDFPLFSKALNAKMKNEIEVPQLAPARQVLLPKEIQKTLLEGLKRVLHHIHEDRTGALRRLSSTRPDQYRAFLELKEQLVGKTSTAESQEKIGIDLGQPSIIYNHTWFGGISYQGNEPELVVVVYLRYGGYGREAAPLAAQVIQKWRQINKT